MAYNKDSYQKQIINHYERIWGKTWKTYLWDKGPFEKLPHDFRVLEFPPNERRNMWTYATCCLSQTTDKEPFELHIFSSIQCPDVIELLTALAYFHRNSASIGLNHTVNFGKSWQNNSLCKHGFISLPYLDGPELENLYIPDFNKSIKFYWLIPITDAEVNYKIKFGVEALEDKFDEGLDYINPARKSLV